jgi:hypothetical protein
MRFLKIPEVEINANYFFNDSVNDSRYVVLHILLMFIYCSTYYFINSNSREVARKTDGHLDNFLVT